MYGGAGDTSYRYFMGSILLVFACRLLGSYLVHNVSHFTSCAHPLKSGGGGALRFYYVILLMHSYEVVCENKAKCSQPRKDIVSLGQKKAYEIFYTFLHRPLILFLASLAPVFHSSFFILFIRRVLCKRAKEQAYSARYFLILCDNVVVLNQLEKS